MILGQKLKLLQCLSDVKIDRYDVWQCFRVLIRPPDQFINVLCLAGGHHGFFPKGFLPMILGQNLKFEIEAKQAISPSVFKVIS